MESVASPDNDQPISPSSTDIVKSSILDYDPNKECFINIQTSSGKLFMCCKQNGSIECVEKRSEATRFLSKPHTNNKVSLKCDYGYLCGDIYGNIKLQSDDYQFTVEIATVKIPSVGKATFKLDDNKCIMYHNSKSNEIIQIKTIKSAFKIEGKRFFIHDATKDPTGEGWRIYKTTDSKTYYQNDITNQTESINTVNTIDASSVDVVKSSILDYDPQKNCYIHIQTSSDKLFICCKKNGLIECVLGRCNATKFLSTPSTNNKVSLKCDYGYLGGDIDGNIKLQPDSYQFTVQMCAMGKASFQLDANKYYMYYNSKSNAIDSSKSKFKNGAKKFFIHDATKDPTGEGWKIRTTADGNTYYQNDITKETSWMKPKSISIKEKKEKRKKMIKVAAATTAVVVTGGLAGLAIAAVAVNTSNNPDGKVNKVVETLPVIGYVPAMVHGVKYLTTDDQKEKQKHKDRAKRATAKATASTAATAIAIGAAAAAPAVAAMAGPAALVTATAAITGASAATVTTVAGGVVGGAAAGFASVAIESAIASTIDDDDIKKDCVDFTAKNVALAMTVGAIGGGIGGGLDANNVIPKSGDFITNKVVDTAIGTVVDATVDKSLGVALGAGAVVGLSAVRTYNTASDMTKSKLNQSTWEYDPQKASYINIQTSTNKLYICCKKNGSIECVENKSDATRFLSKPSTNNKVSLQCNYGYLCGDKKGNIKLQSNDYQFTVKIGSMGKVSFKLADNKRLMCYNSKKNTINSGKSRFKNGAEKFFINQSV